MTEATAKLIIADMAGKIGLRVKFVADYLEAHGYNPLDLSRCVIGAAVAGTLIAVNEAIFLDQPLPEFAL